MSRRFPLALTTRIAAACFGRISAKILRRGAIFTRSSFFPLKIHFKGRQLPACREFSQIFLCLRNTENADLATAAENFLFPASPTYYG
nr:hypothetical protein [uncultured bacterium]